MNVKLQWKARKTGLKLPLTRLPSGFRPGFRRAGRGRRCNGLSETRSVPCRSFPCGGTSEPQRAWLPHPQGAALHFCSMPVSSFPPHEKHPGLLPWFVSVDCSGREKRLLNASLPEHSDGAGFTVRRRSHSGLEPFRRKPPLPLFCMEAGFPGLRQQAGTKQSPAMAD